MQDVDFMECQFIKEQLCFLTYTDFCHNASILKLFYEEMDKNAKIFYKWYIYANIHMSEFFKDAIWNYLNTDDPMAYIELIDNQRKYHAK